MMVEYTGAQQHDVALLCLRRKVPNKPLQCPVIVVADLRPRPWVAGTNQAHAVAQEQAA